MVQEPGRPGIGKQIKLKLRSKGLGCRLIRGTERILASIKKKKDSFIYLLESQGEREREGERGGDLPFTGSLRKWLQ